MARDAPALRVDGRRVDAPAFYAAACDPARSCVVEACAGSGKTWMLVSRMLRALLDGTPPHEILAITFTRAAAGEMRERLDKWLADFSTPRSTHDQRVHALVERGVDPARAEALASELGTLQGRVLSAGRAVEIRTFHGWFAQLLRAAPLALLDRLGVQADAELVEDWREHRPAVHRVFHAALLRDEALRADHAAATAARGRHQLRVWLDTVWDRRIEFELADEAGVLATSVERADDVWPSSTPSRTPPSRSRPRRGPRSCEARRARSPRRAANWRKMRPESLPPRFLCAEAALRRRPLDPLHGGRGAQAPRARPRPAARRAGAGRASASCRPGPPARVARGASAYGSPRPRAARRAGRLQASTRPRRHGRPRARRACPAARRRAVGLDPGAPRRARRPPADRRVPGHEPAAVARAARLVVGLCRRGRGRERATAAGRLHRRRPEAEHLPIPPRRAARVRGGREVRSRRARWQRPGLRSHPPQCASGDRGDQRRVRRRRRIVPGLSPAHDRGRRRRRERGVDAAAHRPSAASAVAARRRRGAPGLARQPHARRG